MFDALISKRRLAMQDNFRSVLIARIAVMLAIVCSTAGCVELKYTAVNRLNDPVAVRASRPLASAYIACSSPKQGNKGYCGYFASELARVLSRKGLAIADTPASADLVINARPSFYLKSQGTFLFLLILPIYRFNENYDGIAMDISYKTDRGSWRKTYRVYYRGWLADDMEMATDLMIKAIAADILFAQPAVQGVEKSQQKGETGHLQDRPNGL